MLVQVLLFASASQIVGQRQIVVEVDPSATLADLARSLADSLPELSSLIAISRWAVDQQFAPLNTPITDRQEIALIPPVSGG